MVPPSSLWISGHPRGPRLSNPPPSPILFPYGPGNSAATCFVVLKYKSCEKATQVYREHLAAQLLTLPGTHQHRAQARLGIILWRASPHAQDQTCPLHNKWQVSNAESRRTRLQFSTNFGISFWQPHYGENSCCLKHWAGFTKHMRKTVI